MQPPSNEVLHARTMFEASSFHSDVKMSIQGALILGGFHSRAAFSSAHHLLYEYIERDEQDDQTVITTVGTYSKPCDGDHRCHRQSTPTRPCTWYDPASLSRSQAPSCPAQLEAFLTSSPFGQGRHRASGSVTCLHI